MSKIVIKGDNNQTFSNIKKSRINSDDKTETHNSSLKWIALTSLIVAIIGLIIKCIASWDSIVQFFSR